MSNSKDEVEPSLLAIETSAAALSVALQVGTTVVARHLHVPRAQSKLAVPTIAEVLAEAAISTQELDGIAFGRGPGSFTGIRVATSIAQGIGLAAAIPLLPISSMACLAQGVLDRETTRQVLVCLDARLGEVYWGLFSSVNGLAKLEGEERVDSPAAVRQPAHQFAFVGSAMQMVDSNLASIRNAAHYRDSARDPDARDLLRLARHAWIQGQTVAPEEATPVYLRNRVVSR